MMSIVLFAATLLSIMALMATAGLYLNKQAPLATGIFRGWAIGVAVYITVLGFVAMVPKKTSALTRRTSYCEDDWCMSIDGISREPVSNGFVYRVAIRISSYANKGTRSAESAWIELVDESNRHFSPVNDPSLPGLDTEVDPGQSVNTALTFDVPSGAKKLALWGGLNGVHYSSFVIGNGDLLGKPRLKFAIQQAYFTIARGIGNTSYRNPIPETTAGSPSRRA
jgi:hypothetical protein